MRKKQVLLSSMLMLFCVGMANAQKAYTYVQQDGTKIDNLGTAAFDLSAASHPTVEFYEGTAVMTIGDNTVARLPMSDKGQLVVDFTSTAASLSRTVSNGYATVYSPFQLQVPETGDVEVYAPTYEAPKLKLNADTKVEAGAIIPAGTGLILKNNGTIDFTFSSGASTDTHTSALSGSALTIAKPVESGKTVYTLSHESNDNTKYGFFAYSGTNMNPGYAYLLATTVSAAKYVSFTFDDATGIGITPALSQCEGVRKYLEDGRVIIVKNGQKYNINGQEVR